MHKPFPVLTNMGEDFAGFYRLYSVLRQKGNYQAFATSIADIQDIFRGTVIKQASNQFTNMIYN